MNLVIKSIDEQYRALVVEYIKENWGSPVMVSRGKAYHADKLPGYIVLMDGELKGIATYHIEGADCEIISLDSMVENQGIGSLLLEEIVKVAQRSTCRRIWLITTNDNTHAIRYYQKRGFDMVAIHRNAVFEARKIKPQIPLLGVDDIPIRHEIELEKLL